MNVALLLRSNHQYNYMRSPLKLLKVAEIMHMNLNNMKYIFIMMQAATAEWVMQF